MKAWHLKAIVDNLVKEHGAEVEILIENEKGRFEPVFWTGFGMKCIDYNAGKVETVVTHFVLAPGDRSAFKDSEPERIGQPL